MTTIGIQNYVRFRQNQTINSVSIGYIYGMPCPQRCEAVESAVVRVLHSIENEHGENEAPWTPTSCLRLDQDDQVT
jgi:hypothetical protein